MTSALLALVLVLQALLTPAQMRNARIVAGETGNSCPHEAQVLIVHMIDRGVTIWYGNATPDLEAMAVALTGLHEPDPAPTARYLLSDADVASGVLADQLGELVRTFDCSNGYHLHAYAAKGREP